MYSEIALRREGMEILMDCLGKVNAERFISSIIREPFDYTVWQETLFPDESVRELSHKAMRHSLKK
jgi:hypothetical protein